MDIQIGLDNNARLDGYRIELMNGNNNTERSCGDFVAFALIFLSFLIGSAGLVVGAPLIIVAAFVVMLLSLLYFRFAS